jgi:hypothetical protein
MNWINDSDWNSQARVIGASDVEPIDAHLRGSAESVSIEPVLLCVYVTSWSWR